VQVNEDTAASKNSNCSQVNSETTVSDVVVERTRNCGQRKRDKKYHCFYCAEEVSQLPRHLYSMHPDEHEVVEITTTTDTAKKSQLLTKLRNMGSHKHNLSVLSKGQGKLTVVYRPTSAGVDSSTYIPCQYCYGYYGRRELWKHVRRCTLAPSTSQQPSGRKSVKPIRAAYRILSSASSHEAMAVISGMRKDAVFMAIKNDPIVHELARKLMQQAGHSPHHINYVRARLRKIGRMLLHVRKDTAALRCATLRTVISPVHFKSVVAAVKAVSGYNSDSHQYAAPSTAIHLGHDVKKCAELLISMAIQETDSVTAKQAQKFLGLCSSDWKYEISGGARREIQAKTFNNPKLLPMTSDVMKLTTCIRQKQAESFVVVKQKNNDSNFIQSFKMLTDATLAQLILFNRRRQGEVSKLTVKQYTDNRAKVSRFAEVEDCLSPLERNLCNCFTRIEIRGKRGKNVPLLLTSDQKEIMDHVVDPDLRRNAGIAQDNPYVFALTKGSVWYVRGHDVLRYFAQNCDAVRPQELRSSNFRKHLATMSQVLNLKRHELDQVATFMGHDVRVHREFYRLPLDVMQTARVVKVLMAMENGTIAKFHGKSLDDVDVSDEFGKRIVPHCIVSSAVELNVN